MATFDIERFPESESAKRMLSYVTPGWYDYSYVGKWIYEVMGREIDTAEAYVEDLLNQLFPETATWGLKYHEIKYGLDVREHWSVADRRRRIIEKRDTRAPMSPWRMEYILKGIIDCNISVTDIAEGANVSHPNIFQVRFYGDGELDMSAAVRKLNEIKQSHTIYELYNTVAVMELNEESAALIKFRMPFTWWDWILDGKYRLDGSKSLDSELPPFIHPIIRWQAQESVIQTFDILRYLLPQFNNSHATSVKEIFRAAFCWYGGSLDGSFLLDGSHLLSAEHPPFFKPKIRVVIASGENLSLGGIFILPKLKNEYEAISRARERFVARWTDYVVTLDGSYDLDGCILLDNEDHPVWDTSRFQFSTEQAENMKMIMYVSANAVLLNGEKLLDGTYFLNEGREEL